MSSMISCSCCWVTVAACIVSLALGALLVSVPEPTALLLLLPVWFFVRMALNAIDGMLAREFGQASALGAYLNELADVISDIALYLPFAFIPGSNPWLVGLVIVLALLSEMAGVLGAMVGSGRRYEGPMGKSDRAAVFAVIALFSGSSVAIDALLNGIWIALALLLVLTIVNRVRAGVAARVLR
jgi:CDP-diacylglycerol--glycerol-3-phosphate 3-phosphatidyltransferase